MCIQGIPSWFNLSRNSKIYISPIKSEYSGSIMDKDNEFRYSEYPKRGRYGDPTQRCAWCGKPISQGSLCFGRGWSGNRYCSVSCKATGDYYLNIVCAISLSIIPWIFYISMIQIAEVVSLSFMAPSYFAVFFLMFLICTIPSWYCVILGYNERKKEGLSETISEI